VYKKKLDIYEIIGNIRYLQKSMNMGNIVINKKLDSLFERKKVTVFEYEDLNIHKKLIEEWLIN